MTDNDITDYKITDNDIQALIDNELDWEQEKQVRRAINNNSIFTDLYNALKSQKQLLQIWWKQKSH